MKTPVKFVFKFFLCYYLVFFLILAFILFGMSFYSYYFILKMKVPFLSLIEYKEIRYIILMPAILSWATWIIATKARD